MNRENKNNLEFAEDEVFTAEKYLRNLASGRTPLDGEELEEENVLREPEVVKALELSADLLGAYLRNGGFNMVRPKRLRPFSMTNEAREKIEVSESPVGVMTLANNIAKVLPYDMKTVRYTNICNWLQYIGALEWVVLETDARKRLATPLGETLGLKNVERTGRDGQKYRTTVYTEEAQRFILDNLEGIMTHTARRNVEKAVERVENPEATSTDPASASTPQ